MIRPLFAALYSLAACLNAAELSKPIASPDLVFEEKGGIVAFEAEHFISQELTEKRAWYLATKDKAAGLKPDPDGNHVADASGGAYLEILPDTRRTHGDKLVQGVNFTPEPGKAAILSYKVHFNTPGKYWLWARAFSTGSEDNGIHFGINNTWPESAARWQTVAKQHWHWRSAQRTAKQHSGVNGILTLDVPSAGVHTIHVAMREDGFELDKVLLANRKDYTPEGLGPKPAIKSGTVPKPFPFVKKENPTLGFDAFDLSGSNFYRDQGKWFAIHPEKHKEATISIAFPFPEGKYDITLHAVGENDGSSTYAVAVNGAKIGTHKAPMSKDTFEEGPKFNATWKNITIGSGDVIDVSAKVATDGEEWARARWSKLVFVPADSKTHTAVAKAKHQNAAKPKPVIPTGPPLQLPRKEDGDGSISITGELKEWHKVTLTLDGPYAHELDNKPNAFNDHSFWVTFTHGSGSPSYTVPGYFAADGNAGNSSADSGTKWRAHLAPDKLGTWLYKISFRTGDKAAYEANAGKALPPFDGIYGSFKVGPTNKIGRDFRAKGRLSYVGKHHLQHQGNKEFFLKAGPDAPETLLAYEDFDGTKALKKNVPLKSWSPHVQDWQKGDPTWKNGKGKGLIGALNYLTKKGVNAFSFLPYNVGGDGANIWPFVAPNDKYHYDCSKLDQWGVVFDHATEKGLYLHFKLQENEMDDNRLGHQLKSSFVPSALDGGKLGPERKLYCREIVARYGHALALNWNIGEESTQSTQEIKDMINYIRQIDPYQHHVVIHTFPQQQDKQYLPLLGFKGLTGASLQNRWDHVHRLTAKWIDASVKAGHPWVAANDEQGKADAGVPPDPDYQGKNQMKPENSIHDIRKYTLWGNLMAGGAGVEYYFGYKLAENDLLAEDWRSRDKSWDYCRIALDFFRDHKIPFQDMTCRDELIGNKERNNSKYCLAKDGELYLVYLPKGGSTEITLPEGSYTVAWFNPRNGETGQAMPLKVAVLKAPDPKDWLAVVRKSENGPKVQAAKKPVAAKKKNEAKWTQLLNKKLSSWEIFMGIPHKSVVVPGFPQSTSEKCTKGTPVGLNKDPLGVFNVIEEDGKPVLHITGQIYAGLSTLKEYENYHLSWQFKWGDKKWPPREKIKRDSGMLAHCVGEHGAFWNVWLRSLECQVQEGDCGDFIALAGTKANIRARLPEGSRRAVYDPTAPLVSNAGYTSHSPSKEAPHGEWNSMELYTIGQTMVFVVNGTPNMVLFDTMQKNPDGDGWIPLTKGRIQIQSEAAEIFYRDIKIRPISKFPSFLKEHTTRPNGPPSLLNYPPKEEKEPLKTEEKPAI